MYSELYLGMLYTSSKNLVVSLLFRIISLFVNYNNKILFKPEYLTIANNLLQYNK